MQTSLFTNQTTVTGKTFPELFKLDTKGKLRSWLISVAERGDGYSVLTLSGLRGGAKVPTEYVVREGKNIGRSNETTPFEQACFEARSKWEAQIRDGYVENPDDARQDVLGSGIPQPMLAQKYSPDGSLKGSKTLAQMKLTGKKIIVQPKLDGIRCLIRVTASKVELFSRKGDKMLPVPHVEEQIRHSYNLEFPDKPELILDGELFTDSMTFNTLNGLLRREVKTPEHFTMLEKVQYHIYDLVDSAKVYPERLEIIRRFYNFDVVTVPSFEIEADDTSIRLKMEEFLSECFEGLMIRTLDCGYENKRSWSLCKYKDFQDAEYKVVGIVEDIRGNGMIGAFVLEMNEPSRDRDGNEIKTFRAGITNLTREESLEIWNNQDKYIGRFATVEYFSLSEFNVPRFPKLKGFRADI